MIEVRQLSWGAFVEQTVAQAILLQLSPEKKWRKQIEGSKFATKNAIALKIKLVDQQLFEDLETIRRIRNAFAHTAVRLRFDAPEVSAEVDALHDVQGAFEIEVERQSP